MKKLTYLVLALLITMGAFAQNTKRFNYQAVIRDGSGGILANQQVVLKIEIIQGELPGTILYTEEWDVETSALGLVNLQIGEGNPDEFESINWAADPFFISVTVDDEYLGTSQLLSVPFAMYAHNVINDDVNDADSDPNNEIQDITLIGNQLSISDGSTVTLPNGGSSSQTLSISGHKLSISGGNSITLPDNTDDNDADPTNEIELPTQVAGDANKALVADGAGNVSWQTGGGGGTLTEAEVDAFVADNGYQLTVDDGDVSQTNEIQDLNLTGDVLKITGNGSATNINLAAYKDDTDDQTLSEILTASTSAGNKKISDLNDPTNPQEAATKKYVDDQLADKADVVVGKGLSSNDYTDAEKAKLAGVELLSNKNQANGYPGLNANSKIDVSQLPAITINTVYSVASQTAQLALAATQGDVAIRTDVSKNFIHNGGSAGDITDWSEMASPGVDVTSVNGKTGVVSIGISDITNLQSSLNDKPSDGDLATIATTGSYDDLIDLPANLDVDATNDLLKTDRC